SSRFFLDHVANAAFCYSPVMRINIRQWVACLLMALLPFQAFAGTRAVSCADWMAHCPGTVAASADCCDHSRPVAKHEGAPSSTSMASCAGATTCAPVAAAVTLPSVALLQGLAPAPESWAVGETPSFISHIPDGLRRPPRLLA